MAPSAGHSAGFASRAKDDPDAPGHGDLESGRPVSRFAFSPAGVSRAMPLRATGPSVCYVRPFTRILDEIEPGWDCLLIARQGDGRKLPMSEVETAVNQLLSRAHT